MPNLTTLLGTWPSLIVAAFAGIGAIFAIFAWVRRTRRDEAEKLMLDSYVKGQIENNGVEKRLRDSVEDAKKNTNPDLSNW